MLLNAGCIIIILPPFHNDWCIIKKSHSDLTAFNPERCTLPVQLHMLFTHILGWFNTNFSFFKNFVPKYLFVVFVKKIVYITYCGCCTEMNWPAAMIIVCIHFSEPSTHRVAPTPFCYITLTVNVEERKCNIHSLMTNVHCSGESGCTIGPWG